MIHCVCGSTARNDLDDALCTLGDQLRRAHRATLGDEPPLPWSRLTTPEAGRWRNEAKAAVQAFREGTA